MHYFHIKQVSSMRFFMQSTQRHFKVLLRIHKKSRFVKGWAVLKETIVLTRSIARFLILICEAQSIWSKLLVLSRLYEKFKEQIVFLLSKKKSYDRN